MADDYLVVSTSAVRSGVKELLANAVASLLEVHPSNPVAFLAHHFDTSGTSVERGVRMIRACPAHRRAFPDTIYRAFRLLSCGSAGDPSILDTLSSLGPLTVSRPDFDQLLLALSSDFPIHIRHRVLDALRRLSPVGTSDVLLNEFQRGVHACVLLEELFDVVEELFVSIDRGRIGEVKLAVLTSALENAAQQSKQREADDLALLFVKNCLHARHTIPDISDSGQTGAFPVKNVDDASRSIRLPELQEIMFSAVFAP